MRLYLASNDLGDFSDKFVELIEENRKTLLISNARDYRSPERRKAIVNEDLGILGDCGLSSAELDLRKYFGKPAELKNFIDNYNPGCIFAMGGNVYALSTALHLSGMDNILRQDISEDKYVYGGYSAGSMVASQDLLNYLSSYGRRTEDRLDQAKLLYGEAYTDGLNLIKEYICPHADENDFAECAKKAERELLNKNLTPILLNNSDVAITRGNNQIEILSP